MNQTKMMNQLANKSPAEVLQYLAEHPVEEDLKKALTLFERGMSVAVALKEKQAEDDQTAIKVGTMLVFGILKKVTEGKTPQTFNQDDWKEVANTVVDYAILKDGQTYTEFVFYLYTRFIDASTDAIHGSVSEEVEQSIRSVSEEIHRQTDQLHKEQISEVDYIENCLWLCLEAIMKLLATSTSSKLANVFGENAELIAQAAASLAFDYCRIKIYQKELDLLHEIMEHQQQLDAELTAKYDEFLTTLNAQTEEMNQLINQAFDSDFHDKLHSSSQLALAMGIPKEEVLETIDDIDAFFM